MQACSARRVLSEYTSHTPGSFLELDPLDENSGCVIYYICYRQQNLLLIKHTFDMNSWVEGICQRNWIRYKTFKL